MRKHYFIACLLFGVLVQIQPVFAGIYQGSERVMVLNGPDVKFLADRSVASLHKGGENSAGGSVSNITAWLNALQSQYQSISPKTAEAYLDNESTVLDQSSNYSSTNKYTFLLQTRFGEYGSLKDRFNTPSGIACDARFIYIADKKNNRIVKMDHQFGSWDTFKLTRDSGTQLDLPDNIALIGSNVLVSDSMNHRLIQFRDDGRYVGTVGEWGILPGNFDVPRGVAQNSRRETIVCDSQNYRIQAFDDRGQFLYEWGQIALDSEGLVSPVDLVVLKDDSVVVADAGTQTVKIFSRTGILLATYFQRNVTGNSIVLEQPAGITIDERGVLYISDLKSNKVVAMTLKGEVMGVIETDSPADVSIWGDFVFVTHSTTHAVSKFRRFIL